MAHPAEPANDAGPGIPQQEHRVHFGGTEIRSFEPGQPVSEEDIADVELPEAEEV